MKFELEPYNLNASDEELISDLKKVVLKLNKSTLTSKEYTENGRFSCSTLSRRFGGWLKALEKAGLEKSREYNIFEKEWFRNLEQVWVKLGKQPTPSDMKRPLSKYSYAGYKRKFGRWRKALEEFIEFVNSEGVEYNTQIISDKTKLKRTKRSIPWRLRFIVMRRDNFKCKICGKSPAKNPEIELHIDHIIPWSKGGCSLPNQVAEVAKSNGKSVTLVMPPVAG